MRKGEDRWDEGDAYDSAPTKEPRERGGRGEGRGRKGTHPGLSSYLKKDARLNGARVWGHGHEEAGGERERYTLNADGGSGSWERCT